jgi:hypothetical protein
VLKIIIPAFVLALALSTTSAGDVSESVQSLIDRAAEIKGEKPVIEPDSDLPPMKCGTPVMLALHHLEKQGIPLPASALAERPLGLPFNHGSTHFLIHYATTGEDACYQPNIDNNPADGVPDYINRVADIFEDVWTVEVNNLGFIEPLVDNGRGGDDRLDVYLLNLGAGFFGFTVADPDSSHTYQMPAFIEIDNDFVGTDYDDSLAAVLNAARVTAAHEFFHTVQYAYDETEFDYDNINDPNSYKPWWLEASSTWMEDIVYDDINDYLNYLPFFFDVPHVGLGTFSYFGQAAFHPYGACVWPIYLSEKYGVDMIKALWEGCATVPGYNLPEVTDSLLRFQSSSLEKSFLEFAVWNTKIADYADPDSSYDEGALFPYFEASETVGHLSTSATPIGLVADPPEHLGVNYIVINTRYIDGGIGIDFNGADLTDAGWHAAVVGHRQAYSPWHDLEVDPLSGSGTGELRGWNYYWDAVLVITVSGITPYYNNYRYDGAVWYDPSLVGEITGNRFKIISAFPSPFVIDDQVREVNIRYSLDLRYDPGDVSLWVFNLAGERIREIEDIGSDFGPQTAAVWDGKNDNNEYVASGIYIVHLEGGGKSSSLKIAVVNNSN